jgi:type IV pilus assembly protein PilO
MEKIKSLAWYYQLAILVGIGSLFYAGVWYFFTSGTRTEIQALNDQIAQLQAKNQAAQVATQRINEFRSLFASKQAEYDELKVLLPEDREITNVLQGLQETARDSRLIVMRFSPREDAMQDSIMAKPVEIEVDSNFNNLRAFFDKMAKLQRIVSITDFNLKQLDNQAGERTLHAQFLLTAYYSSPEALATANQPGPGKPGQPGAPAGQVPPAGQPGAPAPAAPVAK